MSFENILEVTKSIFNRLIIRKGRLIIKMKKINQQFHNRLTVRRDQNVIPKVNWGDVYLSIAQDLAQAMVIVEGEYYESLENN